MKRQKPKLQKRKSRKAESSLSDRAIAEIVERSLILDPVSHEKIFKEALAEFAQHLKNDQKTKKKEIDERDYRQPDRALTDA